MRLKLRANIPEIILGVFLTVAVFAMGMVFESSRTPTSSEKTQQSNNYSGTPIAPEHTADKTTDWLLVALNFLLVVSTGLLWRANNRSAKIAERALTGLERPWLFLEGTTISRRDLPGQQLIPNNWFIKLHWKNVGRAPALIEDCLFQIVPKASIPMSRFTINEAELVAREPLR